MRQFRLFILLSPILATSFLLSACGRDAETESICELSSRWNAASSDVAKVLVEVDSSSAAQIRDSMSEAVATLVAYSTIAPREIRAEVELLLNSYGSLANAFEQINWQGSTSNKDAAVSSAGVRLASNEVQSAQEKFAKYIADNCSFDLDNAIVQFPNSGTTLPDPIVQDESAPEIDAGFDNENSVARAFGFVVVERFGVAITDAQADCVGNALLNATSLKPETVDITYWQLLQEIFNSCNVQIDVAKALESK